MKAVWAAICANGNLQIINHARKRRRNMKTVACLNVPARPCMPVNLKVAACNRHVSSSVFEKWGSRSGAACLRGSGIACGGMKYWYNKESIKICIYIINNNQNQAMLENKISNNHRAGVTKRKHARSIQSIKQAASAREAPPRVSWKRLYQRLISRSNEKSICKLRRLRKCAKAVKRY